MSLQTAYNFGRTIVETLAKGPVIISNPGAALDMLLQLLPGSGTAGLDITKNSNDGVPAVRVNVDATSPGSAGVQVLAPTFASLLVELLVPTGESTSLRGDSLSLGASFDGSPVYIEAFGANAGATGPFSIRSGPGAGGLGANAGPLSVGLGTGAAEDGGFALDPATGILRFRRHALGAAGADETGSTGLVQLDSTQEALLPLQEGIIHLRTDDGGGPVREKGFRAFRAGAGTYGLFGRVYQQTFTDADLGGGGVLNLVHQLDTRALIAAVYDDTGKCVPQTIGVVELYQLIEVDENITNLTIDASLLPLPNTWRVTLLGV